MTKDDFIFNLKRCGCLYKDGETYYEENELIECFEDVGAFNQPSITSQEPKTGHWIGDKAYPICPKCNCNVIERYISCSDYAEMYKPMKYCPNCGAKMVEPQESEDKE